MDLFSLVSAVWHVVFGWLERVLKPCSQGAMDTVSRLMTPFVISGQLKGCWGCYFRQRLGDARLDFPTAATPRALFAPLMGAPPSPLPGPN